MPDLCVVHLVRKKNGIEPFTRFLESYYTHDAGAEHDLLLVFKGFHGRVPEEYEKLLDGRPHKRLFVWDFGFDIRPYFIAARKFDYRYFCFLNSFSVIQDDGWLGKMYSRVSMDGVGLVGASGSYQSLYDSTLVYLENRRRKRRTPLGQAWFELVTMRYRALDTMKMDRYFYRYPNVHLRTNAFMLPREVMLKLHAGLLLSKMSAYRFESGKNSMTRQVLGMGLNVLVVGRDGIGYEKEEWHKSRTYRQGEQDNLLVSDKRTGHYQDGDKIKRHNLILTAWGEEAALEYLNRRQGTE